MCKVLSGHVLRFCQQLRQNGVNVGPGETMDALRALEAVDMADERIFHSALRLVLCSSLEEQEKFDRIYQLYFHSQYKKEDKAGIALFSEEMHTDDKQEKDKRQERYAPGSVLAAPSNDKMGESKGFSLSARLALYDVNGSATPCIPQEKEAEVLKSAKDLCRQVQLCKSRRWKPMKHGVRLDMRRTFRKSVAYGGEVLNLVRKGKPPRQAEFVLLCDGSRSMEGIAETVLQFAWALTRSAKRVETFLFSTRLKRVTGQFKLAFGKARPKLTVQGTEWGGGTRIGESLDTFVSRYGSQLLNPNTIVIIASDGLDTGAIEELESAMRILRRKAAGIIWLNPLLSLSGYLPEARGMKTALPYIDVFTSVESLFTGLRWLKPIR
ncbi:vWA domain-containing protein [Aneurinibacillus aneurinilyticus]|jgi:uncharacterized protein with von Willebrand factor type A (vWA) domain|uniref:VWFA domain-containing protein n=1 Tax=Aneurinibacillus aneurinilyticus ATCC 12856 TaxID=649747 RepID=U1YH50_ANEAE|nr:VWA domain-containing protein [Aneurinibacillus aneurinilyticus]ERI11427.1 hypothetical protein HMPREF0083_00414 [Aneurinibacillus aneurinilyticus ATCC 12856]MCI1694245.1 VWA domain-containing protein [Aneurinibacillus aneurinilyticus]MED0707779.1 VWA domain-containing protein [Aneurinibacillus aneurinilyticus]MED0722444.1 VWA domain-containing protein [Aneurinibacillus aneurinilyticus]MED0733142.1 VWA domain-containing protein [Aneurinibacillus aneurinilyticus]